MLITKLGANNGGMKHQEPPDNLPILEDETDVELAAREDAPFHDLVAGDTLSDVPAPDPQVSRAPAARSLQPIRVDMTDDIHDNERPTRAPRDLLTVEQLAEWLSISPRSARRLVADELLPAYRLPSGLRFKARDVEKYVDNRRVHRRQYGRPETRE